jgi:ribonuclease HI
VGVLLLTPDGERFKYMVHLNFKATNNMADYEALVFGQSIALYLGVRQLLVKGDSQLIIKQVKGKCSCNDPQLAAYLLHPQKLEKDIDVLDLQLIPARTIQSPMSCQQRPPRGLPCLKESLSSSYIDL